MRSCSISSETPFYCASTKIRVPVHCTSIWILNLLLLISCSSQCKTLLSNLLILCVCEGAGGGAKRVCGCVAGTKNQLLLWDYETRFSFCFQKTRIPNPKTINLPKLTNFRRRRRRLSLLDMVLAVTWLGI